MSTFAEKHWGDCSKAVAYNLNFVQMCYVSGSCKWTDYYDIMCEECVKTVQSKDFVYPKGSFSKKDYYILDYYCYGVSEKLKNDMLSFGVPENVFRPIWSSKGKLLLGYQIVPTNILPPTFTENGMEEVSCCRRCGHKTYEIKDEVDGTKAYTGLGYPVYISQKALERMQIINSLYEYPDEVIISLDLYNYLIKKYPRLECRPVFLGSVYEDMEYLRTNKKN